MKDTKEIDIRRLLAKRRQIAVVWSTGDVKKVRPDLTDDQAWKVLQRVERKNDPNIGITWWTLEFIAKDLFGLPPNDDAGTAV